MKVTQRDFARNAQSTARKCQIFFFCGPDEAGAAAAAQSIMASIDNPGERIELSGAQLKADPVLLGDEARSISLFGESRHILVRTAGDEVYEAVGNLLDHMGDICPVVIIATSATDKSRTAKLLEKRDDALVAMFWPPDLNSVTASVRDMADEAGLRLNGDLAARIARATALDVRLARSEIEKIALYCDAAPEHPSTVEQADLDAIGAATEDDGFMPLVNAVLSGETRKLQSELKRMREVSLNPVGLLLAFERRTTQLVALSAKIGPRGDIRSVLNAEKRARRIFVKEERALDTQLRRWRGRKLNRLVERLVELHQALMANNQSAEILLAHGLTEIARAAAPRR